MKQTPIGYYKRVAKQNELAQYPQWEHLLALHFCDWWHCRVAQGSQPGWVDYVVLGHGSHAFVELKARTAKGRAGQLSAGQARYRDSIQTAGGEWVTFLLPDQWPEVHVWLRGHTGRQIYEPGTEPTAWKP